MPHKLSRAVIDVPATSANLGAGFDCLGMALDLVARFSFERARELEIWGCDDDYAGPDNLAWTSFTAGLEALGERLIPVRLGIQSPVPRSGGLGSSSTCVVAGVIAAQVLTGRTVDPHLTLDLATRIEGHPDNVAPAALGGLVSSFSRGGHVWPVRWEVAPHLRFVAVAPPYTVRTSDARRALPATVDRATCVWQMGRCVATAQALEAGDMELLAAACEDRLHEPYRAPLIPDYAELSDVAMEAGAAAFFISGSGATIMAACGSEKDAEAVEAALVNARPSYWIRTLSARAAGAEVVEAE